VPPDAVDPHRPPRSARPPTEPGLGPRPPCLFVPPRHQPGPGREAQPAATDLHIARPPIAHQFYFNPEHRPSAHGPRNVTHMLFRCWPMPGSSFGRPGHSPGAGHGDFPSVGRPSTDGHTAPACRDEVPGRRSLAPGSRTTVTAPRAWPNYYNGPRGMSSPTALPYSSAPDRAPRPARVSPGPARFPIDGLRGVLAPRTLVLRWLGNRERCPPFSPPPPHSAPRASSCSIPDAGIAWSPLKRRRGPKPLRESPVASPNQDDRLGPHSLSRRAHRGVPRFLALTVFFSHRPRT